MLADYYQNQLRKFLDMNSCNYIGIYGEKGCGKTYFILKFIQENTNFFKDHQFKVLIIDLAQMPNITESEFDILIDDVLNKDRAQSGYIRRIFFFDHLDSAIEKDKLTKNIFKRSQNKTSSVLISVSISPVSFFRYRTSNNPDRSFYEPKPYLNFNMIHITHRSLNIDFIAIFKDLITISNFYEIKTLSDTNITIDHIKLFKIIYDSYIKAILSRSTDHSNFYLEYLQKLFNCSNNSKLFCKELVNMNRFRFSSHLIPLHYLFTKVFNSDDLILLNKAIHVIYILCPFIGEYIPFRIKANFSDLLIISMLVVKHIDRLSSTLDLKSSKYALQFQNSNFLEDYKNSDTDFLDNFNNLLKDQELTFVSNEIKPLLLTADATNFIAQELIRLIFFKVFNYELILNKIENKMTISDKEDKS